MAENLSKWVCLELWGRHLHIINGGYKIYKPTVLVSRIAQLPRSPCSLQFLTQTLQLMSITWSFLPARKGVVPKVWSQKEWELGKAWMWLTQMSSEKYAVVWVLCIYIYNCTDTCIHVFCMYVYVIPPNYDSAMNDKATVGIPIH